MHAGLYAYEFSYTGRDSLSVKRELSQGFDCSICLLEDDAENCWMTLERDAKQWIWKSPMYHHHMYDAYMCLKIKPLHNLRHTLTWMVLPVMIWKLQTIDFIVVDSYIFVWIVFHLRATAYRQICVEHSLWDWSSVWASSTSEAKKIKRMASKLPLHSEMLIVIKLGTKLFPSHWNTL